MGTVIQFEEQAVARLRDRLGAAESANEDLIAFARGHSGAVSAIHGAVLHAIESDSFDALLKTVTRDWPELLDLDHVALALVVGERGFRADRNGVTFLAPQLIDRALGAVGTVEMRAVKRGHQLFGSAAPSVRSEALIRIDSPAPMPYGLLALGQDSSLALDGGHGATLLQFLGSSLAAIMRRWILA